MARNNSAIQVSFRATMPPIQSAIKINGNGDGMRIQLDIPEIEIPNAVNLLAMRGKILLVEIVAVDSDNG
jgi:hypothetical protein